MKPYKINVPQCQQQYMALWYILAVPYIILGPAVQLEVVVVYIDPDC